VKRDDLSGAAYGGGKVRKLELLLGEARRTRAETVVTSGGAGSNHAVATAIYAAQLGMHVVLALLPEPPDDRVRRNLLADLAAGAELRLAHGREPWGVGGRQATAEEHGAPYVIAAGGSSPLGNAGFVNAAFELRDQIERGEVPEPDEIYIAMGTMGAAVGLSIGLRAAGLGAQVVAVRASSPGTSSEARVLAMAAETSAYLRGLDPSFPELHPATGNITIAGGYLGAGYGRPTVKAREAIRLAHELARLARPRARLHRQGPGRPRRPRAQVVEPRRLVLEHAQLAGDVAEQRRPPRPPGSVPGLLRRAARRVAVAP
jgi:D-cysteine desulfhydrase